MKARRFDFYFDDWIVGTMGLSPAERGIFITAIAAMGSHGGPIHHEELKRLCSCDLRVYRRAVDRLVELRKLSVKGAYLSNKRCLSEVQKARKRVLSAAENGRKGGRPSKDINDIENPEPNPDHKPNRKLPSPSPSPSPPVGKKEESCSLREQRARGEPPGFAEWWEGYPHKVGKGQARKAWPAAIAKTTPGEMSAGVQQYIATKPPDQKWCNPATWLSGERWLDDPGRTLQTNGHDKQSPVTTLYEGALRAADKLDREERDRRVGGAAVVPLLDGGRSR